jgi:hypothetical protein
MVSSTPTNFPYGNDVFLMVERGHCMLKDEPEQNGRRAVIAGGRKAANEIFSAIGSRERIPGRVYRAVVMNQTMKPCPF